MLNIFNKSNGKVEGGCQLNSFMVRTAVLGVKPMTNMHIPHKQSESIHINFLLNTNKKMAKKKQTNQLSRINCCILSPSFHVIRWPIVRRPDRLSHEKAPGFYEILMESSRVQYTDQLDFIATVFWL